MGEHRELTLDEFVAELKAQDVPKEHLAFRCPMCETIQSAADLIEEGAGETFDDVEKYLGFSCVGRWRGSGEPPGDDRGCNWTLGGLLQLQKLTVIDEEGKRHPRFEPCSKDEAQQHMNAGVGAGG